MSAWRKFPVGTRVRLNRVGLRWLRLQGVLREVAGTLLGQSTQAAAGDTLIYEGVEKLEKLRQQNRATR